MTSLHSPSVASLVSHNVSDCEPDAIEGAFLPSFGQNGRDGNDTFNSFIPHYNKKISSESSNHDRTIRNGDQRSSSPVTLAGVSKNCSLLQHISVSTHELGLPGDGQSERDLDKPGFEPITGRHRMGMQTLLILAANSMIIITTIAFLCFLWFAHQDNRNWRNIIVFGYATRAVTISTLVIRSSIGFQGAICVAMLAALSLESNGIRLIDAPAVSVMRLGMASAWDLLLPMIKGISLTDSTHCYGYPTLALLIFCTSFLLQLSSTVLLSDVRLGSLAGITVRSKSFYDFGYDTSSTWWPGPEGWSFYLHASYPAISRTTTWLRTPRYFPAFAEYTESPTNQSGIDDTGVLLRGFLPLTDQQSRETLRNHSGKAMILDARVSCQRPIFNDISWAYGGASVGNVTGTLSSTIDAPMLWAPKRPIPFFCQFQPVGQSFAICQIESSIRTIINDERRTEGGALLSQFANTSTSQLQAKSADDIAPPWGVGFLIISVSDGPGYETITNGSSAFSKMDYMAHDEWLEVGTMQGWHNYTFSLCYAAWDTTRLSVDFSSTSNRTEPVVRFDLNSSMHSFTEILDQLGHNPNKSTLEERGVMSMAKSRSWVPSDDDVLPFQLQPFVRAQSDIAGLRSQAEIDWSYPQPNWTTLLFNDPIVRSMLPPASSSYGQVIEADPSISGIFHASMAAKGSIAHALSSVITVLSSMAYYDQFAQFATSTDTEQVYFTTVLYPRSAKGLAALITVISVHFVLITTVTALFATKTRFTLLRNSWLNIAQMVNAETVPLLRKSTMSTDAAIEKMLEREGKKNARARIFELGDKVQIRAVEVRRRRDFYAG